jgi:hypothetical protein
MLKYSIFAGAIASFFIISPVFAIGLTQADFDYLTALNVQIDAVVIRSLSPKQQARLHVLINDPTTANEPSTRAKNVSEALAEFKKLQEQEVGHPGKLRDEPARQIPD